MITRREPSRLFSNDGKNFALQGGVYGGYFTGQIGKTVVGGTWKNKKTLRTYAKPTNPNTSGQQSVRSKFKISQVVASTILLQIIHEYWNKQADGQSGFNLFIGTNSQLVTDNQDFLNIVSMKGSYEPLEEVTTATYDDITGDVVWTYPTTVFNIGDASDRVISVVISKRDYVPANKSPILLAYYGAITLRSAATGTVTIPTGWDSPDLFVYLATIQPAVDTVLKIGTSVSKVCVDA